MILEFKSRLATQHYEEVSEKISEMLEDWDNDLMAKCGNDFTVEDVAQLTTNLIQIRCQQFRQVAFEAAQLDIQAAATETAVSAELNRLVSTSSVE